MPTCTKVLPKGLLEALECVVFSEAQARAICARDEEAVVFALLLLTTQLAEQRYASWRQRIGRRLQELIDTPRPTTSPPDNSPPCLSLKSLQTAEVLLRLYPRAALLEKTAVAPDEPR